MKQIVYGGVGGEMQSWRSIFLLTKRSNTAIMIVREVTVKNRAGLHTRPASLIVRTASKYDAAFHIKKDGYKINGKSIIGVMTLAAEKGSTLKLVFDGEDENEAADALQELFEDAFGEVE